MAKITLAKPRFQKPTTKFKQSVLVSFNDGKTNYFPQFNDWMPDDQELLEIIRLWFRNNNITYNPKVNPHWKGAGMLMEMIRKIYKEEMDLLDKPEQTTL